MERSVPSLTWRQKPFDELTLEELYRILRLRQDVFILEQRCIYHDLDDKDQLSHHLMVWEGGRLAAYTRLIPPGVSFPDAASIGRVVVAREFRGKGLGELLMRRSLEGVIALFGRQTIRISAQQHLHDFYRWLGFEQTSEPYMDAGIPHIQMTYSAESAPGGSG